MNFEQRSYGGKYFRPTPEVAFSKAGGLFAVCTPWGSRSIAKKVLQSLEDQVISLHEDLESTSPFAKLTCLSPLANTLRIALMLTNDIVFGTENREEIKFGFEIFACLRNHNEMAWVQVGQPQLIWVRHGLSPLFLGGQGDLNREARGQGQIPIDPLPRQILGIYNSSNISVQSVAIKPSDRFLLLSRSETPASFPLAISRDSTLDSLTNTLAKDSVDMPFWIASLQL